MSATGSRGRRSEAGFTLLEMLVVVGIAALVAGLGFPAIDKLQKGARFTAGRGLTELALREARADALRFGVPVRLAILPGGRGLARDRARQTAMPGSVRLAGPARGVVFFADGSASGGVLTLTDGNRSAGFEITRDTGAIRATP